MAGLSVAHVPAPDRGLNVASSPRALKKGESDLFTNLLARDAGKAIVRGPVQWKLDVFGSTVTNPQGYWTAGSLALLGNGSAVRQIAAGSTSLAVGSPVAGLVKLRSSYARLNANVWGGVEVAGPIYKLMKWVPDAAAPTYTILANAPTNFEDVAPFQNRLVVLGGVPAGGGTANSYALYWSDLNGPIVDAVASWQDDVTGLTNQAIYDSRDTPVALARCGRSLAICMRNSIYLLSGTSPANWSIRQISSSFGCTNKESIVEAAEGFYFMSYQGYCFTDGSTFRIVSENVAPHINQMIVDGNAIACSTLNDYLTICSPTETAPTLLYNTRNETWSTFFSAAFTVAGNTSGAARGVMNTDLHALFYDTRYIWIANWVGTPEQVTSAFRGRDWTGSGTNVFTDIFAQWNSGLVDLGSPITNGQLHRFIMDYVFCPSSDTFNNAWTVTIIDHVTQNVLFTGLSPGQTTNTGLVNIIRQRYVAEVFQEASVIQVQISSVGTSNLVAYRAQEIHDCYVEFQASSQSGSLTI